MCRGCRECEVISLCKIITAQSENDALLQIIFIQLFLRKKEKTCPFSWIKQIFIECSDSSNQDLVIIQTTVRASINSVYSGQQIDIKYVAFVP